MKTTLRDVAIASGVSAMTVSKVLHGTGQSVRVSEKTAERIRKAAKELSYHPNSVARSLRNSRTSMIGVVFDHLNRISEDNPYYPQLLSGIVSALFPQNYTLALCPKLIGPNAQGAMDDGRFDGILWARPDLTETLVGVLSETRVPLVVLHAPPGTVPGVSTFCIDNESALRKTVEHLVGLGHRDLVFVTDTINEHTAEGKARAGSFLKAAASASVRGDIWVWDESPESFTDVFKVNPFVTALAAFSDTLAGRVLVACQRLEIQVPGDLSVVGFDSSVFCDRTVPRLTSVNQSVERIAKDATSHLLELIRGSDTVSGGPEPISAIYDCSLDVRDSTAPPASSKKKL